MELTDETYPRFEIKYDKSKTKREDEIIDADEFIAIKGWKAKGKRISNYKIKTISQIEPKIIDTKPEESIDEEELLNNDIEFEIEDTTSSLKENLTNTKIENDSENLASQMKLNL